MKPNQIFVFTLILLSVSATGNAQPIHEETFVSIGGIEQWVTINGEDASKPAILFIHGGPGSTISPYAENIYGEWTKDFVLIQWDQRGAGKTYGQNNAPEELTREFLIENPLSSQQIVSDGIELSEYLLKRLQKQKLILTGSSWGSMIGAQMALQRPDLFHVYIAHAQVVHYSNNLLNAYQKVLGLAREANDEESIAVLESLGEPPYDFARDAGKLLRVVKKYEAQGSAPPPADWWKVSEAYNNEKDTRHRYDGDDYSFASLMGDKNLGIKPMEAANIDLQETGLNYQIPVFFIHGQHDILCSPELTKAYFDKIKAPQKEFFLIADAAHGFNQSVINMQRKVLNEYICPKIKE